MKWVDAVRTRLRLVFRRRDAEARMRREFDLHLGMEAEHLMRTKGLTRDEARRQARIAFGGLEGHTESLREGRGLAPLGLSWLDVKLGLRMLAKYPGLSLAAVGGLAIAIAISAGYFSFFRALLDSPVPVEDGDRVVVVQQRVVSGHEAGDRFGGTARDVARWREQVTSLEDLSAFRDDKRNLITGDGRAQMVRVASMTASGFRLARVRPVFGRVLVDEDERPGAAPVVVISHEQWRRRFNGDADIIGTSVRLDETPHTIVGVMPEGFAFPIQHQAWVPLRLAEIEAAPGSGQRLHVFARIARGSSISGARAELRAIGDAMAAARPDTHGHIRPQVLQYTQAFIGVDGPEMELFIRSIQFGVGLLLLIVAVNVAILVYARTATRFGEITVRTALGATRRRVVTQLFVEALVLSATASAIGFGLMAIAAAKLAAYQQQSPERPDSMPYWVVPNVSPGAVAYVVLLGVLAAIVIGIVPALKATGRRVQAGLQQFSSRSAAMRLGRAWTALIVVQVAMAVAALPAAIYNAHYALRVGLAQPDPAARPLLRGTLVTSRAVDSPADTRFADRMTTLLQKLEGEPDVSAVTFAQVFPGTEMRVPIESDADRDGPQMTARLNLVAPNLFDVFDVPLLAGRGFVAADARPNAESVIVDRTFANRLAPGGNVVGRRVRVHLDGAPAQNPWMEIVGVVPAFSHRFTAPNGLGTPEPRVYMATAPGRSYPMNLIVRVRTGKPAQYGQRFQEIAAAVDPTMRLERPAGVVEQWDHDRWAYWALSMVIMIATASVLLLSAAGIYAMMSFTISRRSREIGIRVALGADARRVLMAILGRAAAQIGAGVAAGLAIAGVIEWMTPGGNVGGQGVILFPTVVAVMFVVGLLAAFGPARRGLAVPPTEALRSE